MKLRMGMIGGGAGAFIGPVHRMAAELDGQIELVCGAFASTPERSRTSGQQLYGLPAQRCYADYAEMLSAEQHLPATERMHFVSIVTPNHLHCAMASAALEAGFAVVCDKPLAVSTAEAQALLALSKRCDLPVLVTFNYTGYPMVREAQAQLAAGTLGPVRRVVVEYLQGWLAGAADNKQASWRLDPNQAGRAGALGDIGSHCLNLVEFVLGESIAAVAGELHHFGPGRVLDDDAQLRLRFAQGARGSVLLSQVATGEENNLTLRIYGERGALHWAQQSPNSLRLQLADQPMAVLRTGGPGLSAAANAASRLPAGHPEGYLEGFATLYREFAGSFDNSGSWRPLAPNLPDAASGLRGMQLIEAALRSDANNGQWESVE